MNELELTKIKIRPKCVTYMAPSYTAEGFFLPCCYGDRRNKFFKERGFFDMSLNVSNVVDVASEVFGSKTWVDFFNDIQLGTVHPPVCIEQCGINKRTNIKIDMNNGNEFHYHSKVGQ